MDAKPDEKPKEEATPEDKKAEIAEADPDLRFVPLSEIVPLPGTYVKDKPRDDDTDLIAGIKKNGLEKPVILRRDEKGEFQLVDSFHRCQALEMAGMREVRAELYDLLVAKTKE